MSGPHDATWLHIAAALEADGAVALATVAAVRGSGPREVGAVMALTIRGEVLGSVSGGCVESALVADLEEAHAGAPPVERHFGPADDPFGPALTCGGVVTLRVERVAGPDARTLSALHRRALRDEPVGWATGPGGLREVDPSEPARPGELVRRWYPRPRLVVVGSTDVAADLAVFAGRAGRRVTVCDRRPLFTTAERFPAADDVVRARPAAYLATELAAGRLGPRDAVVVATHDPEVDVDVLAAALAAEHGPGFVGALGSLRTSARRRAALDERGVDHRRLRCPVGLEIGNVGTAETALSVLAELVRADRLGADAASDAVPAVR